MYFFYSDVDDDDESDNEANEFDDNEEENPLDMDILDASTKSAKAKTVADVWFEQDIFKQTFENENNDEEFELERKLNSLKSDGITVLSKSSKSTESKIYFFPKNNLIELKFYLDDDDDSSQSEDDIKSKKSKRSLNDDEFEEVPIDHRMFSYLSI